MQDGDTRDVEALACAAIEEFLAGWLEKTLNTHRQTRDSGSSARSTGEALAQLHARDLSAWQERGYLSHLHAVAVVDVYYERRIAQAARALRQSSAQGPRHERSRQDYHRLRHERANVRAWLVARGWDLELESTESETESGVAGNHWMSDHI